MTVVSAVRIAALRPWLVSPRRGVVSRRPRADRVQAVKDGTGIRPVKLRNGLWLVGQDNQGDLLDEG